MLVNEGELWLRPLPAPLPCLTPLQPDDAELLLLLSLWHVDDDCQPSLMGLLEGNRKTADTVLYENNRIKSARTI